ncbi:hypothetical protein B7494_g4501 [Chlorociboria aeruginascens]|nr:hypothetical protein B7494_g4501 [Chlorociboria aeruginascens]
MHVPQTYTNQQWREAGRGTKRRQNNGHPLVVFIDVSVLFVALHAYEMPAADHNPRGHGADAEPPRLQSTSPTNQVTDSHISQVNRHHHTFPHLHYGHAQKHGLLEEPDKSRRPSSIYTGSYSQGHYVREGSRSSSRSSPPPSPRRSMNGPQLEDMLQGVDLEVQTYGVEELRDGFFDSSFFKPPQVDHEHLMKQAEHTLPAALRNRNPLSPRQFLPRQWHGLKHMVRSIATTRDGVKLIKSLLSFFIAYILCLVPVVRDWLGHYNYIMVVSAIFNHSGRTVGAQIDGLVLTILGTASGLGWGAFALWLSDSSSTARRGYGGILATFLILFTACIAALRSYYIRLYQFVICAGIAISYTCLADTSSDVDWKKLFNYGIPWVVGQAICFVVCCAVFPDAGARSLAVSFHDAFTVIQKGLVLPHPENITSNRQLAYTFVSLSQAHRDLALDFSVTRFRPADVVSLRNPMQGVVRAIISLKTETRLFDWIGESPSTREITADSSSSPESQIDSQRSRPGKTSSSIPRMEGDPVVIEIDGKGSPIERSDTEDRAVKLIASKLAEPTLELITCMRTSIERCDAVAMNMTGYRKYLGPPMTVSSDIKGILIAIQKAMADYDVKEDELLRHPELPPTYTSHPEVVELFLFVHPVRQAATCVEGLLIEVYELQQLNRGWRLYPPSYPFPKALQRTNAQVRHDRGGVTAGFYFRNQTELAQTLKGLSNTYKPLPRKDNNRADVEPKPGISRAETIGKYAEEEEMATSNKVLRIRFGIWKGLHRLQGFETRFALKVVMATTLLAVPAWLPQSRGWWNTSESWWAPATAWLMMHPRVGGNLQDLVTRALCCVLGAVWGGLAYGAGDGNPYIMAVFAAIYMVPMMYRFTQSPHPRSGLIGCVSFTVVSLAAYTTDGLPSVVEISWTRGLAFVVGVVAAVLVNWFLWPFVARHELRKALSATLIYCSIIYRGVVAKYVYYEDGQEPTPEDIEHSELLEGRLREGFVRIRQLLALTRHEIRLRGPFNPLPYSGLIDGCERFFEYLVAVRQSSLFWHPHYMADNEQAAESLLAFRRDAVAAILMNLYVLAGALRGDRKVPRYLPSAAVARKRLLDHMARLEAEHAAKAFSKPLTRSQTLEQGEERKWSQIYSYSYSQSLTGCVQQLEQLQMFTKEIVGEQGFDPVDTTEYEDLSRDNKATRDAGWS